MPFTKETAKQARNKAANRGPGIFSKTVKETVLNAFNELQSDPKNNIVSFAKKYPRDFYQIASKLIPTEINAKINKVSLEIVRTITTSSEHPPSITAEGD